MDKKYFLEVLHRYLNDTATLEEQEFLIKFYDLFQSEHDINTYLNDEQREALEKEIKDSIRENIYGNCRPDKKVIALKTRFIRVAAAAIFVAVCLTGILFLQKSKMHKDTASLYSVRKKKPNLFVVLRDGSKVILSYGSKLSYASSFDGLAKREVYLIGQAFFDIKHDNLKPFIVHTGNLETTVLGTAFNVKAIPGDKTITVTVTRGRVKVSDSNRLLGIIIPNQQITYNKKESNSTQGKIDAKSSTVWIGQDDLYFEDVTFGEAAKLLEERFKVKIIFKNEIVQSKHFTSTFDKSASLEQELKSICEFNDAFYSYDKARTTITISSKSQPN